MAKSQNQVPAQAEVKPVEAPVEAESPANPTEGTTKTEGTLIVNAPVQAKEAVKVIDLGNGTTRYDY